MTDSARMGTLVAVSNVDLTVADPSEDVRGLEGIDRHGEKIGNVDDLLMDSEEQRVRFLQVAQGGFLGIGEEHFLVPVEAVMRIDAERVHIDLMRGGMGDAPGYSPELAEEPDYYTDVHGYWGYGPYWAPGYAYPRYPGIAP
jgi:sporulation protein YlmC with PRC-barrel domain